MYAASLVPPPTPRHPPVPGADRSAPKGRQPKSWRDSIIDPGVRTRTEVEGVWLIAGTPRAAGRRWFWTDTLVACINGVDTKLGEIMITSAPDGETATSRNLDGQCKTGRDVKWIVRTSGFASATGPRN